MKDWSVESMVIMFGLTHSLGGASPTLGLMAIAYIADVSTPGAKVRPYYLRHPPFGNETANAHRIFNIISVVV